MVRILDLVIELWGHYILVSATVIGLVAWEASMMFAAVTIKVSILGRYRYCPFGEEISFTAISSQSTAVMVGILNSLHIWE